MNRLARTRSQHFAPSPRKVASPLKAKAKHSRLHVTKRRRVGGAGSGLAVAHSARAAPTAVSPPPSFDADAGAVGGSSSRRTRERKRGSVDVFGTGESSASASASASASEDESDDAASEEEEEEEEDGDDDGHDSAEMSPRKRKRVARRPGRVGAGAGADNGNGAGARDGSGSESGTGDSGSWIEVDDEEPEFIAESDQHLLTDAPAYALHRLRKAELIRLWKVAGMWSDEAQVGEQEQGAGEGEEGEMSKKDLVEGLLAARPPVISSSVRIMSPLPSPRGSPRRRASESQDKRRPRSPISRLRLGDIDADATPRAVPRTRSRATRGDAPRTVPRRRPNGSGYNRRKSMDERKARFGDVKSPANGLLRRRLSTSSTYTTTTTDSSPPEDPPRDTPHRARRRPSRSKPTVPSDGSASTETDDIEDESAEPTPLVARLRSRTKSFQEPPPSEVEADDEGEDDEEEHDNGHGDATVDDDDGEPMDSPLSRRGKGLSRKDSRMLPKRRARRKALQAIQANGEESDDMDVDEGVDWGDGDERMHVESSPKPMQTRRSSRLSISSRSAPTSSEMDPTGNGAPDSELTPAPPSSAMDVEDEDEDEDAEDGQDEVDDDDFDGEADGDPRTTRSGKAFGTYQSRQARLRQEAMDDPDMDIDEDDEDYEADADLANATITSLSRLLRDELVQLCESRGLEVGGTKPQLARALIEWGPRSSSSTSTARPASGEILPAIGSHKHVSGKTTPVLLREHVHAHDPATPTPRADTSRRAKDKDKGKGKGKGKGKSKDRDRAGIETARPRRAGDKRSSGRSAAKGRAEDGDGDDDDEPEEEATSETSKRTNGEAELNLDLAELGLEDSMIRPEHLQKLERIGSGGFKDVYVGRMKGRRVAISEFRGHLSEMDIRELKLLAEFSHPNIVKFRGICIPEDSSQVPCMLVSELCENGDLFDYIRNVDPPPLKRILGLMLDISRGLEYLHTRTPAIIHRDCKSSNILINRAGQAKVGDFGLARVKTSTRSMIRSLVGTVNWQAPELWHPQPRYDYKVDVFSAGMVWWEMLSGWGTGDKKYPWEGHNEHYIYDAVGQKLRRPSLAGLRKAWGNEPVNLMERMWHQDPAERPTMSDVVADLEAMIADI